MAHLTRTDFATLAGVSKPAITKATQAGHVLVGPDGKIDPDNPLNTAYLARHLVEKAKEPERPKGKKTRARQPEPEPEDDGLEAEPEPDTGDSNDLVKGAMEAVNLDKEKKRLQIRFLTVQSQQKEIAVEEAKGNLIRRDLVARRIAAFDAAIKTHLRDMPRRVSARLHAIALSEGPHVLESELESEISECLKRSLEAAVSQELI